MSEISYSSTVYTRKYYLSDLGHFTDSSTGSLVTLDKHTGAVQWKVRIGSPIVALYLVQVKKFYFMVTSDILDIT